MKKYLGEIIQVEDVMPLGSADHEEKQRVIRKAIAEKIPNVCSQCIKAELTAERREFSDTTVHSAFCRSPCSLVDLEFLLEPATTGLAVCPETITLRVPKGSTADTVKKIFYDLLKSLEGGYTILRLLQRDELDIRLCDTRANEIAIDLLDIRVFRLESLRITWADLDSSDSIRHKFDFGTLPHRGTENRELGLFHYKETPKLTDEELLDQALAYIEEEEYLESKKKAALFS